MGAQGGGMKLVAIHRVFTGKPVSRGYVMDRDTGKVVWACPHRHRYQHAINAQMCAEKHLRKMVRDDPTLIVWIKPQ